ncbi:hypothetical protein BWQ96_00909 [Gracilariopsis chorda]|uniref:Uncharacterized protein n=1 Tax=Gracilariopsis chorda TaxID=448386 RepID=A0A2V3J4M0_9FLOR|nr:hypothetical protein BWQ96_00909 [Gracilariopsis chorda]|eukprot:PXF49335.1 hypothetical protein BWQ96_00909 [Gracilariopsis chorda]
MGVARSDIMAHAPLAWCLVAPSATPSSASFAAPRCALTPPTDARKRAVAAVALAASASILLSLGAAPQCEAAIIQQPPCYKGDGPGCEASASENALIHKLLEQSRAKREQNDNTMLEKYWKQGYGDYFSYGFNKQLVRDQHGKWSLVDPDDVPSRVQRRIEQLMKRPK